MISDLRGGATLAAATRLNYIMKKRDQMVGASTALVALAALAGDYQAGSAEF